MTQLVIAEFFTGRLTFCLIAFFIRQGFIAGNFGIQGVGLAAQFVKLFGFILGQGALFTFGLGEQGAHLGG